MSLTLATVADALIEFILSLLRDPDVQAEFENDPYQALASRGLQHAGPSDVAAVAPIIIERTHVVHVAVPKPVHVERDNSPVVREIREVTSQFQWVDDRDTIVDQSVNQNIWAHGDVTQTFDNEAIVASGDEAVAAGNDATVDKTWDESTTIEAGEDANIGNDTDVQVIEDSMNEETDESTTTDESTDVVVEDSFDEQTERSEADGSFNNTETTTESTDVQIDAKYADAADSQGLPLADTQSIAADDTAAGEQPVAEAEVAAPDVLYPDESSASQYVETDVAGEGDIVFADDSMSIDERTDDDNF